MGKIVFTPLWVDAHRPHRDSLVLHVHCGEDVLPDRPGRLEAEAVHVGRGVVARESGQVDAGHGAQEPGGLRFATFVKRGFYHANYDTVPATAS